MNSVLNKFLNTDLKEAVELFPKLFAILAGFTYLLGFLIVQTYLWAYGYVSFELLSIQYFLIGIVALIVPVCALILFLYIVSNYIKPSPNLGTLITLIIVAVGWILSLFLNPFINQVRPAFKDDTMLIGLFGSFLLFGPVVMGWLYSRYFPPLPSSPSFILVMTSSLTIIGIITYSFAYTVYIYRGMQPFLGGGAPRYVRLVVDNSAVAGLIDAGVDVSTETKLTDVVKLIYVAKDEYLLEPCDSYIDNAVILRKELVKTVRIGLLECPTTDSTESVPSTPTPP